MSVTVSTACGTAQPSLVRIRTRSPPLLVVLMVAAFQVPFDITQVNDTVSYATPGRLYPGRNPNGAIPRGWGMVPGVMTIT